MITELDLFSESNALWFFISTGAHFGVGSSVGILTRMSGRLILNGSSKFSCFSVWRRIASHSAPMNDPRITSIELSIRASAVCFSAICSPWSVFIVITFSGSDFM